jgi:hypothetical protein
VNNGKSWNSSSSMEKEFKLDFRFARTIDRLGEWSRRSRCFDSQLMSFLSRWQVKQIPFSLHAICRDNEKLNSIYKLRESREEQLLAPVQHQLSGEANDLWRLCKLNSKHRVETRGERRGNYINLWARASQSYHQSLDSTRRTLLCSRSHWPSRRSHLHAFRDAAQWGLRFPDQWPVTSERDHWWIFTSLTINLYPLVVLHRSEKSIRNP